MELMELGSTIRAAREASGISQGDLARMVALSRVTVNYAERGRVAIGADALLRIMAALGMSVVAPSPERPKRATDLLARQASVSYRQPIPASAVNRAFVTGIVEERYQAHIATMLDEASDALLLAGVREAAARSDVPVARVWSNVKTLAEALRSPHPRWQRAA
ncbi:MAG: helix-turn-helix transcriptional regulator [Actinomycetales bacterium]